MFNVERKSKPKKIKAEDIRGNKTWYLHEERR